jgi:hypothetical protein
VKKLSFVIFSLLFSFAVFAQRTEQIEAIHVKDVTFSEFCTLLFKQFSVKVYYDSKWVKDLKISIDKDSISPILAVKEAIKATGLEVSVWHGNLVILPGENLITTLPAYDFKKKFHSGTDSVSGILTKSEERYITGRKADVAQSLRIGLKGSSIPGVKAKLRGRILDEETGEPIFSATMYITETQTGAVSDINGFISISLAPGKYNARFEYLGYAQKKYDLEVNSDGNFTVNMTKSIIQMKEVVVYGDRQMSIRAKDPGLDKLSIKAIRELPMMMGERCQELSAWAKDHPD